MDLLEPRNIKLKAWNRESRLMIRLSSVDVVKGVLQRQNHVFLLFTGCHDQLGEEIYEKDILLKERSRYCAWWDPAVNGWMMVPMEGGEGRRLIPSESNGYTRLGSLFELEVPN